MSRKPDRPEMTPSDFRLNAGEMVEWMTEYMRQVHRRPVVPCTSPGDTLRRLPKEPPGRGQGFDQIFEDFRQIIVPNMTHWNHPGWFAYFPANNSPASILAEMATAAMGAQCMSWVTSPAATELEQLVMLWLRKMIGLPEDYTGVIQDTASTSTLTALISAREKASAFEYSKKGAAGENAAKLTVYTSEEAHSSVLKAVSISGIGTDNLRLIGTDSSFAMKAAELEKAIETDRENCLVPCCVVATIGTTSSTAIDPVEDIARICRKHRVWLHIDAAYGGAAAILPEKRELFRGMRQADSIVFNPHKWLFTNFDCSAYFVRDVDTLRRSFSISPEYLKTKHDDIDAAVNFRDWGIPLGRRFRALKLWFVIRNFGVEGLRSRLRFHIQLAGELRDWVKERKDFELMAPSPFGLVCFRYHPQGVDDDESLNRLNRRLLDQAEKHAHFHLTHTLLRGRFTIRFCIGQLRTTRTDVKEAWRRLCEEADML